jgi:chorismate mutase
LDEITNLRKKIDEIDEKILFLLKERIEACKLIGRIKMEKGLPTIDPEREAQKYRDIASGANMLGIDVDSVKSIYEKIIDVCVKVQEKCICTRKDAV